MEPITSLYVHSRVDSNTFTMGNPLPESFLTLCQNQLYPLELALVLFHRDVNSFWCSVYENPSGKDWVSQYWQVKFPNWHRLILHQQHIFESYKLNIYSAVLLVLFHRVVNSLWFSLSLQCVRIRVVRTGFPVRATSARIRRVVTRRGARIRVRRPESASSTEWRKGDHPPKRLNVFKVHIFALQQKTLPLLCSIETNKINYHRWISKRILC